MSRERWEDWIEWVGGAGQRGDDPGGGARRKGGSDQGAGAGQGAGSQPQGGGAPSGGARRGSGAAGGGPRPGLRNSVRIVAGARRSRRLRVAPGETVRPTSDMVREAIFDSLGPIAGLTVLDLFAGTGAMGLEALSRGVARAVFVEQDRRVAEVLRQNIADLEYQPQSRVLVTDYRDALQDLSRAGQRFDLLFMDPPYRMLTEAEVALGPFIPVIVQDGGVVVLESDKGSHPTLGAVPVFDRVYGDTRVTMVTI